ncbi:MAG: SGNH/GDSL hydrolase family protein, partial [Patescibacteria group bacterium]|nr:SGNH/GDSL hydrolase family protein [Patescibacteria group bacterium]
MKLAISTRRLAVLGAIGLVLIGGGLAYIELFLSRPMGEGPAGPPVSPAAFQKPWTDRPILLVGLGDSIVAGLGASRQERSFFNRLVRNPADEFSDMQGTCLSAVLPSLRHENLAVSGTTSIQHAEIVEQRLPPQEPDVFGLIVMTTGGNDLIHSYWQRPPREGAMYGATLEQAKPWIRNYEVRLAAMLDAIEARFPGGCEVYLGDIYDPTDGVG